MGFILRVYDWNLFHYVCSKLSFSSLHVSIRFVLFKLHINIYITISKKGLWWQLSCWCKKMISKQIFCSKKEFIKREELEKKIGERKWAEKCFGTFMKNYVQNDWILNEMCDYLADWRVKNRIFLLPIEILCVYSQVYFSYH